MHDRNTRPVKDAFGDPVIVRRVALRILPGRDLRQVDHGSETCPLGRVREVGRRLDEPVMVQEVTNHDFRAGASKRLGTRVLLVDQCADGMSLLHKTLHRIAAGPAGRSGHQEFLCAHCSSPEWAAWASTRSRLVSSSRATAVTRSSPNWPKNEDGRSYSKAAWPPSFS